MFVASGAAFPDALAGAAAAAKQHAPLVITAPDSLPVVDQGRAGPPASRSRSSSWAGRPASRPPSSSSSTPWSRIPPIDVSRIAGAIAIATAGAIATTFFTGPVAVLYIADGLNFPDALVGAAAAGHFGAPILLVAPTSLPAATAQAIKTLAPQAIKVLGGTASVSDAVKDAVGAVAKVTPTRLWGADRYATAVAISQDAYPGSPSVDTLYVASGANFPDALVGAALGKPVVLAQGRTVAASVLAEVTRLGPGRIVFLGSPASISYSVVLAIRGAFPAAT